MATNNFKMIGAIYKSASSEYRDKMPNPEKVYNTIMEKGNLLGTNDYQQRETDATQSAIAQTMSALFDPMNENLYNQFLDILVNRIGMVKIRTNKWDNPLAAFKQEKLNFGSSVQEIATKWVKAHTYDDEDETLLKMNRPEVAQCFHSVNREDRYDITIVDDELRMAFTQEFGLNNLVSQLIQNVFNSDNYDEYRSMLNIMSEYENRWGFYKEHLDSVPGEDDDTAERDGKAFLKKVRTLVGKLRFPSTKYNAKIIEDVPVFAKPDELVLLYSPEVASSISVDVLASLFNVEKAQLQVKTIIVDEFPIPNAFALLTTRDWWMCFDKIYRMTSFYNPQTLARNNYLHHWQVLSASPFVPAILFTTDDASEEPVFEQSVTGMTLTSEKEIAFPGDVFKLFPNLIGTFDGGDGTAKPAHAATFEMHYEGQTSKNSRTFVDRLGRLHVQKTAKIGDILVVTATTTYRNPSTKQDEVFSATCRIYIGEPPSPTEKYFVNAIDSLSIKDKFDRQIPLNMEFVGYRQSNEDMEYYIPQFKCTNQIVAFEDANPWDISFAMKEQAVAQNVKFKYGNDEKTSPFEYDPLNEDDGYLPEFTCVAADLDNSTYACDLLFDINHVERPVPKITGGYLDEVDHSKQHAISVPGASEQEVGVVCEGTFADAIDDRYDILPVPTYNVENVDDLDLYWKNAEMENYQKVTGSVVWLSNVDYTLYLKVVDRTQGISTDDENWMVYKLEPESPPLRHFYLYRGGNQLLHTYDFDDTISTFFDFIDSSYNPPVGNEWHLDGSCNGVSVYYEDNDVDILYVEGGENVDVSDVISEDENKYSIYPNKDKRINCCVSPDSLITLANGDKKAIKDLQIGDKYLSVCELGKFDKVIHKNDDKVYKIKFDDDSELLLSSYHKILTDNDFKSIDDGLSVGEKSINKKIVSIEKIDESIDTINIKASKCIGYFAENTMVSNKPGN